MPTDQAQRDASTLHRPRPQLLRIVVAVPPRAADAAGYIVVASRDGGGRTQGSKRASRRQTVCMRSDSLRDEFQRLQNHKNEHKRGYEFQPFVGGLFKREHFRVEPNPRAAAPHQTDLLATRGSEVFLIETKWRSDPATITDVDLLFARLAALPASVTGVMFSYSGFTPAVLEKVRDQSARPVLLVTGDELNRLIELGVNLSALLRRKQDALHPPRSSGRRPPRRISPSAQDEA